MRLTLAVLGLAVTGLALSLWIGFRRQQRAGSQLTEALIRGAGDDAVERAQVNELHDLPAPVARYFRRVLQHEQPAIRLARLTQAGTLRADMHSDRWLSFEANQLIAPAATGFVWNARVVIAPLIHVQVRDALIAGRGSGQVNLLSAFTVASDGGHAAINAGALHRYLAEAVWYPTALLPSAKLRWSPIDDSTALATLTDNDVSVALEFRFNSAGEVASIFSGGRWGRFDGAYEQLPWEGHFRNYVTRDGMIVPSEGEVGWYADGEWRSVWKGTVTESHYEFAR
jgi:hypothetical protein